MTKLELSIDLPDHLARDAREAGLLTPDAMAELLRSGVRQKALERIKAGHARAGDEPAPTLAELQAIVDEVRKRRA